MELFGTERSLLKITWTTKIIVMWTLWQNAQGHTLFNCNSQLCERNFIWGPFTVTSNWLLSWSTDRRQHQEATLTYVWLWSVLCHGVGPKRPALSRRMRARTGSLADWGVMPVVALLWKAACLPTPSWFVRLILSLLSFRSSHLLSSNGPFRVLKHPSFYPV